MDHDSISFGYFDQDATKYLTELVAELLADHEIECESFSFALDVTYATPE
jgi:hypothetical protein